MRTTLCDLLGIEHPIVGFSPSEHVAAAISRGPAGKPDYGWAHRYAASHPAHAVA